MRGHGSGSLITLKALTYSPTRVGIVAGPTTSLPEALGGAAVSQSEHPSPRFLGRLIAVDAEQILDGNATSLFALVIAGAAAE